QSFSNMLLSLTPPVPSFTTTTTTDTIYSVTGTGSSTGYYTRTTTTTSTTQTFLNGTVTFGSTLYYVVVTTFDQTSNVFVTTISPDFTSPEDSPGSASFNVAVAPGPMSQFGFSGLPASVPTGTPFSFTVRAEDAYGNLTPTYTGTVDFTSSDSQV